MVLVVSLLFLVVSVVEVDIGVFGDVLLLVFMLLMVMQMLYLDVIFNCSLCGLLLFLLDVGCLMVLVFILCQFGFSVWGEVLLLLDVLGGVVVCYDVVLQILVLDVLLLQLILFIILLECVVVFMLVVSVLLGVLFNYDVYVSYNQDVGNLVFIIQWCVFGFGCGVLESIQLLCIYQEGCSGYWCGESVCLDSYWELDFFDSVMILIVGDFFSGFVDWSCLVCMGGVQIGCNYGLQFYCVFIFMFIFFGEVVVFFSVELYVDGLCQYNGEVLVGLFQFVVQFGISGVGNVQVVIIDVYGCMQIVDFVFYGVQQLFVKGFIDWLLGVGWMCCEYGIYFFVYDILVLVSGIWCYGVSNCFIVEVYVEGGGGVVNVGVGGWWLLGFGGVFNVVYVGSCVNGCEGGQWVLGYSWNNWCVNVNVVICCIYGDYCDLGVLQEVLFFDVIDQFILGLILGCVGVISVSYLWLFYFDGDDNCYVSLFWNKIFLVCWFVYLFFNQDLFDCDDCSVYLLVLVSLGCN